MKYERCMKWRWEERRNWVGWGESIEINEWCEYELWMSGKDKDGVNEGWDDWMVG